MHNLQESSQGVIVEGLHVLKLVTSVIHMKYRVFHGGPPWQFWKSLEAGGHRTRSLEKSGNGERGLTCTACHPVPTLCPPCARWFHFNYFDVGQAPTG